MPMRSTTTTGGTAYANGFVGPVDITDHIKLDVSDLTTAEVDADGYLKPNLPLKQDGTLLDGTAGEYAYGATIEPIKIVAANPTNASLLADTSDPLIAVCVVGLLNLDVVEDNLGRALSANELAGIRAAGSRLALTST